MSFSIPAGNSLLTDFGKNWRWFFVWGIALLILGSLAIWYTTASTILSVVFLGFLILFSGMLIIIDSFAFWWRRWKGFFLHFLMGLLYLFAGYVMIFNPLWASISLTLLLAVLYIVLGVFRVVYSLSMRMPHWGWVLFNGLIALLLGVIILAQWPVSGMYIIGLFVGIDLLFTGWAYIMGAMGAHALMKKP